MKHLHLYLKANNADLLKRILHVLSHHTLAQLYGLLGFGRDRHATHTKTMDGWRQVLPTDSLSLHMLSIAYPTISLDNMLSLKQYRWVVVVVPSLLHVNFVVSSVLNAHVSFVVSFKYTLPLFQTFSSDLNGQQKQYHINNKHVTPNGMHYYFFKLWIADDDASTITNNDILVESMNAYDAWCKHYLSSAPLLLDISVGNAKNDSIPCTAYSECRCVVISWSS